MHLKKMGSITLPVSKPHAVFMSYPAQGHINPMLKLAKLLHSKGFFITFVLTEYSHRRLLKSCGAAALDGLPDFRYAAIPDGLPESDIDVAQDVASVDESTAKNCLEPFCELIEGINNNTAVPPVTCIISDGVMSFTLAAAERFGLPEMLFWTTSACGLLGFTQYRPLLEKGYIPLKDMNQVTNGYLDTTIDWVTGMKDTIRLRDFPSFIRTTDPKDPLFNIHMEYAEIATRSKALIINTFDALEQYVLDGLSNMFPCIYTVGPLQLMINNHIFDTSLYETMSTSLWKEDLDFIKWLDTKEPKSVLYVNFGSSTMVTAQQLTEFAWGLANSEKSFLWVIRPDMVAGESAMVPIEFVEETKDRCKLISWCPQEQVLNHPAVGGFLTHSGWNSTIESIVSGVPVICWPFFADQQTNCRFSCVEWEMGMEIDNNVKRDEVESLVKELMDGEKGKKMKEKALEWKRKAEEAANVGGSSYLNLDKMINEVLLQ